jgi:hypothetical protein
MSALIPYETGDIEVLVELGIGRQANAGVWDESYWDYSVWGHEDTALGDWVDVTCSISEIELTGGASAADGVITEINATTGGLTMHGAEWNPWSSTYTDVLGPAVPVRIRWRHGGETDWRPMFYGETDGWPYDRATEVSALPIIDPTGQLANFKLSKLEAPVGNLENLTARINRVLDAARWPVERRDIPTDRTLPVIATVFDATVWALVRTAADTDLGVIECDRAGDIVYRPVGQLGQWQAIKLEPRLTDEHTGDPTEVCVVNFTRSDPIVVRNDVTVSRADNPAVTDDAPVPARYINDASISRFQDRTYDRDDLINADDSWSGVVASVILNNDSWPRPHPQTATLDIRTDTRVADLLLGAEVGNTLDVHDEGADFLCAIVGYTCTITRAGLSGSLILQDVSGWAAGGWDSATWDRDGWGV